MTDMGEGCFDWIDADDSEDKRKLAEYRAEGRRIFAILNAPGSAVRAFSECRRVRG